MNPGDGMMELDEIAAQQLTLAVFNDVRAYYARMPTHRARVFEVLTALAFVAAKTLQATDADADEMRRWFADCLDQQEADIVAAQEHSDARH
jgi:hypothetical protein